MLVLIISVSLEAEEASADEMTSDGMLPNNVIQGF